MWNHFINYVGGLNREALEACGHFQVIPQHAASGMSGGCCYIFIKEKINEADERSKFSLAHRANEDAFGFCHFMGSSSVTASVTYLEVKLLGNVAARSMHLGLKM